MYREFRDLKYGVEVTVNNGKTKIIKGPRFFPGTVEEAFEILEFFGSSLNLDVILYDVDNITGIWGFLDLKYGDNCVPESIEQDMERIRKHFDLRFAVMKDWSSVEICISVIYKLICSSVNFFYMELFELQTGTYCGWLLDQVKAVKPLLDDGKLVEATKQVHSYPEDLDINSCTLDNYGVCFNLFFKDFGEELNGPFFLEIKALFGRNPWLLEDSENLEAFKSKLLVILKREKTYDEKKPAMEFIKELPKFFCERLLFFLECLNFSQEQCKASLDLTWEEAFLSLEGR